MLRSFVDSLSSFLDGMVFACWDLEMVKVGSNKAPVVRYETESTQTKKIKQKGLYLLARCVPNGKPRWSLCHQIRREQDITKQQSLPRRWGSWLRRRPLCSLCERGTRVSRKPNYVTIELLCMIYEWLNIFFWLVCWLFKCFRNFVYSLYF